MTTLLSNAAIPANSATPIQLIGQPSLRVVTPQADITDVAGLWSVMLKMVNVLNLTKTTTPTGGAIAAPQISLPTRAFLVVNEQTTPSSYQFYINPSITTGAPTWDSHCEESCLSLPNNGSESWTVPNTEIPTSIPRQQSFTLTYYTFCTKTSTGYSPLLLTSTPGPLPSGVSIQQQTLNAEDTIYTTYQELNWVLQHELDHLNGILYTDYMQLGPSNYLNWSPAEAVLGIAQQDGTYPAPTYAYETNSTLANATVVSPVPSGSAALTDAQAALVFGSLTPTSTTSALHK